MFIIITSVYLLKKVYQLKKKFQAFFLMTEVFNSLSVHAKAVVEVSLDWQYVMVC